MLVKPCDYLLLAPLHRAALVNDHLINRSFFHDVNFNMVNAARLAYEKVTALSLQPCKNIYYFCIQIFLA